MKISSLGRYTGYSAPVADGYLRTSEYVSVPDGCRIAVDVLRPTMNGKALSGPLPAVLLATGYRRSFRKAEVSFQTPSRQKLIGHLPVGAMVTKYEEHAQARALVNHGYVMVVADLRGTGASFGQYGLTIWRDAQDMAEITRWITEQPWSEGSVGMIGGSWEGVIQIATASLEASRVKAIMPAVPAIGALDILRPNGVYAKRFLDLWAAMRRGQDTVETAPPVDADIDGALWRAAQAERASKAERAAVDDLLPEDIENCSADRWGRLCGAASPDLADPVTGELGSTLERVADLNRSKTAVYLTTGWWDMFIPWTCIDLYCSLAGPPKKLTIGPWHHGQGYSTIECLRWFDFHLKGVENGIANEPGIAIATMDADHGTTWRTSDVWPPIGTTPQTLFLGRDRNGRGLLVETATSATADICEVDAAGGLGPGHRLSGFMTQMFLNPAILELADQPLAYSTAPFEQAVDLIGTVEARLCIATSGNSGGVVIVLEEMLADGSQHYITEGLLNFCDRKTVAPGWVHAGNGHHSVRAEHRMPVLPHEPMDLVIEMAPVAWRISAASRLRLTVLGSDIQNFWWHDIGAPDQLSMELGGSSSVTFPLLDIDADAADDLVDAFADEPGSVAFSVRSTARR